jgi:hypothetical protein
LILNSKAASEKEQLFLIVSYCTDSLRENILETYDAELERLPPYQKGFLMRFSF